MDIDVKQVEAFSVRLAKELQALPWNDQRELLLRIGRAELRMQSDGLERPPWKGPLSKGELLGREVVVPTEQGERRGRAICFGTLNDGAYWEGSVIVHVPASGTIHEAFGSATRLAGSEDLDRMREEDVMAQRLVQAAAAVERAPEETKPVTPKRKPFKDPSLVPELLSIARGHAKVASIDEGSYWKVSARKGDRRIYLSKSGGVRVALSGFSVDHPGCQAVSEEEARERHLGLVRGELVFSDRKVGVEAFREALDLLDG